MRVGGVRLPVDAVLYKEKGSLMIHFDPITHDTKDILLVEGAPPIQENISEYTLLAVAFLRQLLLDLASPDTVSGTAAWAYIRHVSQARCSTPVCLCSSCESLDTFAALLNIDPSSLLQRLQERDYTIKLHIADITKHGQRRNQDGLPYTRVKSRNTRVKPKRGNSIRKTLQRALPTPQHALSVVHIVAIRQAYRHGVPLGTIAHATGISSGGIRRICQTVGYPGTKRLKRDITKLQEFTQQWAEYVDLDLAVNGSL